MDPRIHAFVISWSGQAENASAIEASVAGEVERLTVIHSDEHDEAPLGARWRRVPNDWFYGRKFRQSLADFDGEVMLQITADAACADWPRLVRRCREGYRAIDRLGLWAPKVDHTYWTLDRTGVGRLGDSEICFVTMVDSIVWALSADVLERLRGLDYEVNNLGWGIERLAALHCHVTGRLVALDEGVEVRHPPGTGYSAEEATAQYQVFARQITLAERLHDIVMQEFMDRPR